MADSDPHPRRRGAQPGNENARKHGLYASARLTAERQRLLSVSGDEDLADALRADIDAMRMSMATLLKEADFDPFHVAALARAVSGHVAALAKLTPKQRDELSTATENALADLRQMAENT